MHYYFSLLLSFVGLAISRIEVADVPDCARNCLAKSASLVAQTCGTINVACLCRTTRFVNAISCCLATDCTTAEQAIAIQFNQEQCASVNATAPAFVGCSPSGLSSASDDVATASKSGSSVGSSLSSSNSGLALTEIVTQPTKFSDPSPTTVAFDGRPLLTSSCAMPFFALESGIQGSAVLYPEVGCASYRQGCCPFDSTLSAVLPQCPQDYFTTAGGCCPFGYSVYDTMIGLTNLCYSVPSTPFVPATIPTITGLSVITDHVFARKYDLQNPARRSVSSAQIAGIVIGVVAGIGAALSVVLWKLIQRKKKNNAIVHPDTQTSPIEEHITPGDNTSEKLQELASHERTELATETSSTIALPITPKPKPWPFPGSSPPAYEGKITRPSSIRSAGPQELPGSTFIHEHHPAANDSERGLLKEPRTPPRSVTESSAAGSPAISHAVSPPLSSNSSPVPESQAGNSRAIVSPLNSPGFRKGNEGNDGRN